jgi:hypothetical protein
MDGRKKDTNGFSAFWGSWAYLRAASVPRRGGDWLGAGVGILAVDVGWKPENTYHTLSLVWEESKGREMEGRTSVELERGDGETSS